MIKKKLKSCSDKRNSVPKRVGLKGKHLIYRYVFMLFKGIIKPTRNVLY